MVFEVVNDLIPHLGTSPPAVIVNGRAAFPPPTWVKVLAFEIVRALALLHERDTGTWAKHP